MGVVDTEVAGRGDSVQGASAEYVDVKFTVEQKEKSAVVRGKVWKKGEAEPGAWTVEFEDPSPNREGAAAVYAYISNVTETEPGSEAYFDNLSITPAGGK